MDRQRRGDRLDLNARLVTEVDRRQLELVTVLADAPLGLVAPYSTLRIVRWKFKSGARTLVRCK
jgi:hypothetical protein